VFCIIFSGFRSFIELISGFAGDMDGLESLVILEISVVVVETDVKVDDNGSFEWDDDVKGACNVSSSLLFTVEWLWFWLVELFPIWLSVKASTSRFSSWFGFQSALMNEKFRNSSWFIALTIIGSIGVSIGSSDVKSLSKLLVSFRSRF
jgi:hypothetical protein